MLLTTCYIYFTCYLHILRSVQNCSAFLVRERFEEDLTAKVQKLHRLSLNKLSNL